MFVNWLKSFCMSEILLSFTLKYYGNRRNLGSLQQPDGF